MPEHNIVFEKAYRFAVKIVKVYQHLSEQKREFVLSKQLVRSGTSIAANVSEAIGGISKAEFSAKMSIAYKECRETKNWLDLLRDTGYLEGEVHRELHDDAHEIGGLLYSIVRTCRKKR